MIDYSKYELDTSQYSRIIKNKISNKYNLIEIIVSGRKKLFKILDEPKKTVSKKGKERIEHKTLICTNKISDIGIGNLKKESFTAFLAEFKRNLHKTIIEKPELLELKIGYNKSKARKDTTNWDKIVDGDYFYCIDFKSAYWQIGYKIGYVSEEMFKSYIGLDDYKSAKRLCFSFLGRNVLANYFSESLIGKMTSIRCNTNAYKNVYDNVRNLLNNYLYEMVNLTNGNYILYHTDGICVPVEYVNPIKKFLIDNELLFKITICKKLNNSQYSIGNELMKF